MVDLCKYKNIHCIGIGGIGLSAIAEILLSRGYSVSGSDMKESDITSKLAKMGARIFIGHRAENVDNADLVVYSAAVGKDNPEIMRAAERGIETVTRAQRVRKQHCHIRNPREDYNHLYGFFNSRQSRTCAYHTGWRKPG